MTAPARSAGTGPRRSPSPSARQTRPDLYVVGGRPRGDRRARTGMVLAAATLVVFGALLASAVFHSMLVTGQAHLDDVHTQIRAEQDQLARDRLRLASYQSPARIAREAERIGLVASDHQTWINPGSDSDPVVTGERVSPQAQNELAAATAEDGAGR